MYDVGEIFFMRVIRVFRVFFGGEKKKNIYIHIYSRNQSRWRRVHISSPHCPFSAPFLTILNLENNHCNMLGNIKYYAKFRLKIFTLEKNHIWIGIVNMLIYYCIGSAENFYFRFRRIYFYL